MHHTNNIVNQGIKPQASTHGPDLRDQHLELVKKKETGFLVPLQGSFGCISMARDIRVVPGLCSGDLVPDKGSLSARSLASVVPVLPENSTLPTGPGYPRGQP